MFEKYSYKTKFYALLVVFAMLLVAAYKRSFSTLISLVHENRELTEKTKQAANGVPNIKEIRAELATIDKIIGREGLDKEKIQQGIISFAAKHEKVSISDLQAIHQYTDESHTAYTNQLDVTGSINELMAIAYDFEKNFDYSRLVNINFYTIRKNNKPDALHLKMIFQNYEKNK